MILYQINMETENLKRVWFNLMCRSDNYADLSDGELRKLCEERMILEDAHTVVFWYLYGEASKSCDFTNLDRPDRIEKIDKRMKKMTYCEIVNLYIEKAYKEKVKRDKNRKGVWI